MEVHESQLPFLDILLCKDGRTIYTDIYYKGTDSHQYLDFNSCHPKHCKTNIPYTLARRICTIIANHEIREQRLEELRIFLVRRNYPTTLINSSFEKAKGQTIEELRTPKAKEPEGYWESKGNSESFKFVRRIKEYNGENKSYCNQTTTEKLKRNFNESGIFNVQRHANCDKVQ
ncbi:uncharacterized protein LOC114519844 [Dendronephthya gigantea]|uniref:uncharacterized protein LOC114519844 n=1 Tax=Dendronephthya gigantea TaxID=151771 RepID=UPI0010692B8A|nr:uncharacterized protein LOC114519844 [Dendronephthya gigantea]